MMSEALEVRAWLYSKANRLVNGSEKRANFWYEKEWSRLVGRKFDDVIADLYWTI